MIPARPAWNSGIPQQIPMKIKEGWSTMTHCRGCGKLAHCDPDDLCADCTCPVCGYPDEECRCDCAECNETKDPS